MRLIRTQRSQGSPATTVDGIGVCRTGDDVPDDRAIAGAAAQALIWYRAVPPNTVHVTVRDGWMTLTGTVSWMAERGAAERAIRNLRGVRGVSNVVVVSNTPEDEDFGPASAAALAAPTRERGRA